MRRDYVLFIIHNLYILGMANSIRGRPINIKNTKNDMLNSIIYHIQMRMKNIKNICSTIADLILNSGRMSVNDVGQQAFLVSIIETEIEKIILKIT
jgi:hypothetical protein